MTANQQENNRLLELKNIHLTNRIGSTILLNDISLQIGNQEKVGIIGATGAGKSTLLKLLNNLHSPHQGQFLFADKLVNKVNPLELRRQIVLVPQEPKLLGMTVQSTLVYPLQLQQLSSAEIKQRLSWCLDKLSIRESWLSRYENELSLGQRQLVAIARGMIMKPRVLLLDEPTSALDVGKTSWLQKVLNDLSQEQDLTVIVVNHDLNWIRDFCDRLIYLEQGMIRIDESIDRVQWNLIEKNLWQDNVEQDFDNF